MIQKKIIVEYRRLNSLDRGAFHNWLIANTVVGALALLGLIAVASIYSGANSNIATAQKEK